MPIQLTEKQKDLQKILSHMVSKIPDRPLAKAKVQKSWMGLKLDDRLENTVPLLIFTDQTYISLVASCSLDVGHLFVVCSVNSEGAEIKLELANINFILEDRDWKKRFKRIKKPRGKKNVPVVD